MMLDDLRGLNVQQRSAVLASYLGWTLDAFDFFILVFVFGDVAKSLAGGNTDLVSSLAVFLTLAARPIGAFIFGLAADKFGRRPTLMVDVVLFSALEFATAFSPDLITFMVLRTLFGVAMGGEWGVGSSLTMETIPVKSRGVVSGILQAGYPSGYFVASIVYGLLYTTIGWRGLFMVGALPALLVLYIRTQVDESPSFVAKERAVDEPGIAQVLHANAGRFAFAVAIMTLFNFFSHGTQDLYPRFLQHERAFSVHETSLITGIFNVGAICGGVFFGALSQRIGRCRAITLAALLALPAIPFWAYGSTGVILAAGAFIIQFAVQGAWGVVPVYLNELSPDEVRGTFPGFSYQIGNLIAAVNVPLQNLIARHHGNDHAFSLALVVGIVAVLLAALSYLGPEAHSVVFAGGKPAEAEGAVT